MGDLVSKLVALDLRLQTCTQAWLVFTALFEIPVLYQLGVQRLNGSAVSDVVRAVHKDSNKEGKCSDAFTNLYFLFIATLTMTRLALVSDMASKSMAFTVAVLHVFEALFFYTTYSSGYGGLVAGIKADPILIVILGNGVFFTYYWASLMAV